MYIVIFIYIILFELNRNPWHGPWNKLHFFDKETEARKVSKSMCAVREGEIILMLQSYIMLPHLPSLYIFLSIDLPSKP